MKKFSALHSCLDNHWQQPASVGPVWPCQSRLRVVKFFLFFFFTSAVPAPCFLVALVVVCYCFSSVPLQQSFRLLCNRSKNKHNATSTNYYSYHDYCRLGGTIILQYQCQLHEPICGNAALMVQECPTHCSEQPHMYFLNLHCAYNNYLYDCLHSTM